jgi:hypothetical protein
MAAKNQQSQNDSSSSLLWFAGVVGATVGVACWAYSRREVSRWERARRKLDDVVEWSAEEIEPWMLIGAGAAAAGATALAYRRRQAPNTWDQLKRRGAQVLNDTKKQANPWMGLATNAAVGLATAAYSRRNQPKDQLSQNMAAAGEKITEAGARILKGVQKITEETKQLYPRVRQLIA